MTVARALVLPLLAIISCFLTGIYVSDLITTSNYPTRCEMTYSWPVYTPLTGSVWKGAKHYKYGLYAVHMHQFREELTGIPVLFIPGHMGSYKQARSIARHLFDADDKLFDVFAVDFDEELSGLNGNFVQAQAQYINEVIRVILKQYQKQIRQQTRNKASFTRKTPDNVVIMAHSMGGIDVQLAKTLGNYKRHSIQHVISLGSPFTKPVFPFDTDLHHIYHQIETGTSLNPSSTVYVSIAGGHKDTTVHASFSRLSSSSPSIALLAPALPQVVVTMDHLCLLWCHQLLKQIATSIVQVIDPDTRVLRRDAEERLAVVQSHFLGEESETTNHTVLLSSHEHGLTDGYWDVSEFTRYNLKMPRILVTLFRAQYATLFVMMYVLVLHILHVQLTHWQAKFDISASVSAAPNSMDALPSFVSLLHPAAHVPPFVYSIRETMSLSPSRWSFSVVTLVVSIVVGVGMELSRQFTSVHAVGWEILQLLVLYLHAIGLLYIMANVLSLLSILVRPLVHVGSAITLRVVSLKRWVVIALVLKIVLFIGHVRDFELMAFDSSARGLALLVVGSAVVFVLHLLELGVSASTSGKYNDQQRYRTTLFAFYLLSMVPWVGKIALFLTIIQTPPPQLHHEVVFQAISYIFVFALLSWLMVRTKREMLPLPPTAFFDVVDESSSSVYDDEDQDRVKMITAENCPRCVFEDGGPGAIFIEYQHVFSTRHIKMSSTGEVVRVGATFRVISCDCAYRFKQPFEYCAFCTRSCRLCGGGSGNYEEAQRFQEYLNKHRTQRALQSLVATMLEVCALLLVVTAHSKTEHCLFYITPFVTIMLLVYHAWLRHPTESKRLQRQHRRRNNTSAINKAKKKRQQQQRKQRNINNTTRASNNRPTTTTTSKKQETTRNDGSIFTMD